MIELTDFLPTLRAAVPGFHSHGPNPEQEQCILHDPATPLVIVAGPGSGKTTVLVLRALRLVFVEDWQPESIVITTFTRKAAEEIRSRLIGWGLRVRSHLMQHGEPALRPQLDRVDINRFLTGTLDSICEEVLTTLRSPEDPVSALVEGFVADSFLAKEGLFPVGAHQSQDLTDYLTPLNHEGREPHNFPAKVKICRTLIDRFRHDLVDVAGFRAGTPHTAGRALLADADRAYRQGMSEGLRMDFSLLEEAFLNRLRSGGLSRFTDGVRALLVDEYQDTNPLQEEIYDSVVQLSGSSYTAVGDDDQSLYRFRGATVELFSNFQSRLAARLPQLPQSRRIDLTRNYRSTPEIVGFFNDFVTNDPAFQPARTAPPKPPIVASLPSHGVGVLGMFRPTREELADDLSDLLVNVFRSGGASLPGGGTVRASADGGDFGDSVLLGSTVNEFGSAFGSQAPRARFPRLLREALERQNVGVFNPRGRALCDIPQVQRLLGCLLLCLDPGGSVQGTARIEGPARRNLDLWRREAEDFVSSSPPPASPHSLRQFVDAWGRRSSQTGSQWPSEWPVLELGFKLLSWFPFFQNDPEGQVYLEAISRCIAQSAIHSPYRSMIVHGRPPHDDNSVRYAIQDILAPLALSSVEVDEEIMPHVPRDRFPIMTIHQSKGLEFPLVVIDVASDFRMNHAKQKFRRFPEEEAAVHRIEDDLADCSSIGPLRQARPPLRRAFDDLIRLYYVAYSRPQSVLLLVGLDGCLRSNTKIRNVATFWREDGSWPWSSAGPGNPPLAPNIPLTLI